MRVKIEADGRVLMGTASDIVKQMQYLAFGKEEQSLCDYLEWLRDRIEQQTGARIEYGGATGKERAESFVLALAGAGLIEVLRGK